MISLFLHDTKHLLRSALVNRDAWCGTDGAAGNLILLHSTSVIQDVPPVPCIR